jgi:multiple sugar transport system permease protein
MSAVGDATKRPDRSRPVGVGAVTRVGSRGGRYVLLLALCLVTALPFLWSTSVALTDRVDGISLENFRLAWDRANFDRYTLTTLSFALVTAIGATLVSCFAGYAFARLRFPGRRALFWLILATTMIPAAVYMLPLFLLMVRFPLAGGNDLVGQGGTGFYNTFAGMVLPGLVATTTIFLMRQFFRTLPRELEDAARLDGAGELRIFWQVMLPLAKPGLVAVFVLQFQDSWNAYLWPLIIANTQDLWTLQVALSSFDRIQVGNFAGPGTLQAAALLSSIPVILVFILGQRQFRQGIALTGMR